MFKKLITFYLASFILFSCTYKGVHAADRIVLRSVPSDLWYDNVYLIADRITWMNYKNFTVQIGDMGQLLYNFPEWYHGKYPPELYREDISGDKLEDIIVVLNNDAAGYGKPFKDIHVLNQIRDPFKRFEEFPVEPVEVTEKQHIKMEMKGSVVNVLADKNEYSVDLGKYNYDNPHNPYAYIERVDYAVKNGKLLSTIPAYVALDNSVSGELIGNFHVDYDLDGKIYKAKSVVFKQHFPDRKTY